jgi:hypothetical protein
MSTQRCYVALTAIPLRTEEGLSDVGDDRFFFVKWREKNDLVETCVFEFVDLVLKFGGGANEAGSINEFGGHKPFLFGNDPAVVAKVCAKMAALRWCVFEFSDVVAPNV